MPKFNKVLSQLEAIHQIAPPVVRQEDPILISDFIHHIFENANDYGINHLSKEWLNGMSNKDSSIAVNFVGNILEQQGHLLSRKSILEGINNFKQELDYE